MADSLYAKTIEECNYYLSQGLSVIPVRDKPGIYKGREYTVKSAYPWAKWQTERATVGEIFHLLTERYETHGFGIVGGKVSGNLEIIDIDTKNWPGIDIKLFQDIKSFLPHIFDVLRIHQSPSKGYHIFYKVDGHEIPGNKKLAFQEDAKEAAIETRGEGGYVVASTQMGYRVVKNNPIPVISWEDRCSIISICEGYNQKIKVKKEVASKSVDDYYDENPFDHFNNSAAAESVLTDHGWILNGSNNNFIWFTKPDSKKGGVHASFNREKKVYYIFTSGTIFEPSTGYNPSTALSILKHEGDKKKTFRWLVDNQYGKVKPEREKSAAAKAARKNADLPANFSPEAKALAASIRTELDQLHPYGTFWEYNDQSNIVINREQLMMVANYLGFKYNDGNVVKIEGQLIHKITERDFQDCLKGYIKEPDNNEYFKVANAFEAFMEAHGKYTMARIPILDLSLILNDSREVCYKFFTNGYLCIQLSGIVFLEYDTLDALIWAEKVQNRNYNRHDGGLYVDYLNKALVYPDEAHNVIGYLTHEYKDETTPYIIVLTEQCPDPKQGGGSGKNIFCNLLGHTTTYTSKPGVQTKFDEKFFQSWNGQRIFGISDVQKDFDFSFLKEPASGNFILKKLHKDEKIISIEDAPKLIVQTNFSYECSDGGLVRRIIPVEFTDFFTKCGGLDIHYGKHFPRNWSEEDWGGFDTFIAECIQKWMKATLKLYPSQLTLTGWEKQFVQSFGHTAHDFIAQNFEEWKKIQFVSNEDWSASLANFYKENDIQPKFHVTNRRLYESVKVYCDKNKIIFNLNDQKKIMNVNVKGKSFMFEAPF